MSRRAASARQRTLAAPSLQVHAARGASDHGDDAAAALLLHERKHGARHADVAEELEAPVVAPLRVGDLEKRAAADGAGVVDEDVDATQPLSRGAHRALDLCEVREIGG